MKLKDKKAEVDAYFAKTSPDEIIEKFKEMGCEFEDIEELKTAKQIVADFNVKYEAMTTKDLVVKCCFIHNYVDDIFIDKKDDYSFDTKMFFLLELIKEFAENPYHSSEIKTVLVITNVFKANRILKHQRESLLKNYQCILKRKVIDNK